MTRYVLRLTNGAYLGGRSWTDDVQHAQRFEFYTVALWQAIMVLELSQDAFTVELVAEAIE